MRTIINIILFSISIVPNIYGQFYHNRNIKMANGDTINRINKMNTYEGYHIISDNDKYIISDSNHYYAGFFKNGVPYGIWLEHNKDGSFSKGEYEVSHETFYDDSTKSNVTLTRGIGYKKGVWSFYGKDSILTKKILYQLTKTKKSSVWKESIEVDSGKYQIIHFRKYKSNKWNSKFSTVLEKNYSPKGTLIYHKHENFFRSKTIEYRSNGIIKTLSKYSTIINRDVEIKYNRKGIKSHKTIDRTFNRGGIEGCPVFR